MQIIFLGTSSGTPTKTRNVSATGIRCNDKKSWCLVDCGEGTQHRILHTRLGLQHLEAILITHVHGDHCFGLPGLLASASLIGRTEPLTIIAPAGIREFVEMTQRISETRLNFEIRFIDTSECSDPVLTSDFSIQVAALSHRVPSCAFVFEELHINRALNISKLKEEGIDAGPVWGKLQKGIDVSLASGEVLNANDFLLESEKPRKVIISGDNDRPELLQNYASGLDVLVHEATYTHDIAQKVGPQPMHSSARSVAQFAESIQLKNLVLTHFSARYRDQGESPAISDIDTEAREHYKGRLFMANDLDVFDLDKQGELKLS